MIRRLSTRVGYLALAAATLLLAVSTADAQPRGRALGWYGRGYLPGYSGSWLSYGVPGYYGYGYSPYYYGSPYWGSGLSFGLGTGYYRGYPYSGYSFAPGYYAYSTPTYYYSTPSYSYVTPSYAYTSPSINAPIYSMAPSGGTTAPGSDSTGTQSLYRPPAGTASLLVRLPANAKLWMNDQEMTTVSGPERQFVTPATLEPGKTYHFDLKAQWEENGQTVTRERGMDFQVGNQIIVDFTQNPPTANPIPVFSAAPDAGNAPQGVAPADNQPQNPPPTGGFAFLTVRLPQGARLWVEDYQSVQTGPERNLVSPPTLEPGKPYHYTLKAQWEENGQTVTRERNANIQAGSQVTVDFFSPET